MSGYYRMARGWQDHPVFRNDAFSKRDAFVWLIEQAAYAEAEIGVTKGVIKLRRGQLSHSLRYMAKAWKWTEPKVRRYFLLLQTCSIIDASTDAGQTVITICNYDKYQASPQDADATIDATPTQRRRNADAKKKEGKEVSKEVREETNVSSARARSSNKGTRLPDDWQPPRLAADTMAAKAIARRDQSWHERTAERFQNYWRGKSGQAAVKADWGATWANWVIKQDEDDARSRPRDTHGGWPQAGGTVLSSPC